MENTRAHRDKSINNDEAKEEKIETDPPLQRPTLGQMAHKTLYNHHPYQWLEEGDRFVILGEQSQLEPELHKQELLKAGLGNPDDYEAIQRHFEFKGG